MYVGKKDHYRKRKKIIEIFKSNKGKQNDPY